MSSNKNEEPQEFCYLCQDTREVTGHITLNCPNAVCKSCGGKGHMTKNCPDILLNLKPPDSFLPISSETSKTDHGFKREYPNSYNTNSEILTCNYKKKKSEVYKCVSQCRQKLVPCSSCQIYMAKGSTEIFSVNSYLNQTIFVTFTLDDVPPSTTMVEIVKVGANDNFEILTGPCCLNENQITVAFKVLANHLVTGTFDALARTFLCEIPEKSSKNQPKKSWNKWREQDNVSSTNLLTISTTNKKHQPSPSKPLITGKPGCLAPTNLANVKEKNIQIIFIGFEAITDSKNLPFCSRMSLDRIALCDIRGRFIRLFNILSQCDFRNDQKAKERKVFYEIIELLKRDVSEENGKIVFVCNNLKFIELFLGKLQHIIETSLLHQEFIHNILGAHVTDFMGTECQSAISYVKKASKNMSPLNIIKLEDLNLVHLHSFPTFEMNSMYFQQKSWTEYCPMRTGKSIIEVFRKDPHFFRQTEADSESAWLKCKNM